MLFTVSGEECHLSIQSDGDIAIQHLAKDVINERLEEGEGVGEPERHHKSFIVTCGSVKHHHITAILLA